jgi:hypothetical protein
MKTLLSLTLVLVAIPAFAQVPVLSCNAEVCQPVKKQLSVTPAVWQGLLARQFVYVPPTPRVQRDAEDFGPTVTIIPDSTPQPSIPPTYPLTNNSYTPFYPPIYPSFYGWTLDGVQAIPGSFSFPLRREHARQGVVGRSADEDHDAPPFRQPVPSAPPPPPSPAKEDRPAPPRGSLPLGRLSVR